ncbi:MAG: PKD domain-containing protein, partial [Gemmatimonadales bacterium]
YTTALAVSPTGKLLYAVTPGAGTLGPIVLPANTAGAPLSDPYPLASLPDALAFTPKGSTAWLALGGSVQKVSVATGKLGTAVSVPSGGSAAELAMVPDQAPIASFTATPVPTGSPTGFDASASTAVSSPIAKYAWNFGDGTVATTTSPTTTHT